MRICVYVASVHGVCAYMFVRERERVCVCVIPFSEESTGHFK